MTRFARLFLGAITAGFAVASCVAGDAGPPITPSVASGTSSTTELASETSTRPVATTLAEASDRTRAAELPLPFTEVAGAVWGDRIVVVGGLDAGGEASDRTYFYDPNADSWVTGPNLPVALHHTAAATLGDRIYVVGGYSVDDRGWVAESAVWSLGPDDESWVAEPDLVTARGALAVVSTGDRLFAIGGVGSDAAFLTPPRSWSPEIRDGDPGLNYRSHGSTWRRLQS